jgi:hypothetical protein
MGLVRRPRKGSALQGALNYVRKKPIGGILPYSKDLEIR